MAGAARREGQVLLASASCARGWKGGVCVPNTERERPDLPWGGCSGASILGTTTPGVSSETALPLRPQYPGSRIPKVQDPRASFQTEPGVPGNLPGQAAEGSCSRGPLDAPRPPEAGTARRGRAGRPGRGSPESPATAAAVGALEEAQNRAQERGDLVSLGLPWAPRGKRVLRSVA